MALNIENATVGYDNAGVNQLMSDIHQEVIEAARDKLAGGLNDLNTAIDDCWVGHSADVFKQNMANDVEKIKHALEQAESALNSEVSQIIQKMGQVDQELVQGR